MTITVSEVQSYSDLKQWVTFPLGLYATIRTISPATREELDFFRPPKPFIKLAQTKLLLARRNGEMVGRVCGIINPLEAKKLGFKRGRFGCLKALMILRWPPPCWGTWRSGLSAKPAGR